MDELTRQLWRKSFLTAAVLWLLCSLGAGMALDGGWFLGYYTVVSILFWIGVSIYFRLGLDYSPMDWWVFRFGPLILFFLGLVAGQLISIFSR